MPHVLKILTHDFWRNHPEHRNSIFMPIYRKKKTIYFIHLTWLQTIAEIPTDIIWITVEFKYANYHHVSN